MFLSKIVVSNFRNITHFESSLSPSINIFSGNNGAGKSSILEAIYYLNTAKSFRSPRHQNLIQLNKDAFQIFGSFREETNRKADIGIQRAANQVTIHLNREKVNSIAEIAKIAPIQVITPNAHALIEGGPSIRRAFLDWGLFHVEQKFHSHWSQYRKILKQRNAALKSERDAGLVHIWDQPLQVHGCIIHELRQAYVAKLQVMLKQHLPPFSEFEHNEIRYQSGWDTGHSLLDCLKRNIKKDMALGYTSVGPHRSDLTISINGTLAENLLSRGQQKLLVLLLYLVQLDILYMSTNRPCIVLLDDITSELDEQLRRYLLSKLANYNSQIMMSSLDPGIIDTQAFVEPKLFHVEHGLIKEMV